MKNYNNMTPEQIEEDDRKEIRNMIEYYGIEGLQKMIAEVQELLKEGESERYQSKY
jgi:hypothetical protein